MQTSPDNDPSASSTAEERRRLEVFNRAERIGGLGSWEWTPTTGELLWSENLFRLYGLEPGAIVPSAEYVFALIHPNDLERVQGVVAGMVAGSGVRTVDYRLLLAEGEVRDLQATLAVLEKGDHEEERVAGSVQDVTAERSVDRKLHAYAAVSKALDEWTEFEAGAKALLAGLADALDLDFGALWIPGRDSLTCKVIWHEESELLEAVATATKDWRPGRGSPMLGRAWVSSQPIVSPDPWAGSPKERAAAIRAAGLNATIAMPAVMVGETLAVLEFRSGDQLDPTDQLLRALTGIGHEIGYFLARHRGELVEPVLTPREVQILQLAARAFSAAQIAEELFLSPATVKRHFHGAYVKLGVSNRAAAVGLAMRQGYIE